MTREFEVEVIGKERLELESDKGSLGDDGTMLLLNREEMLVGLTVGEHDGLATKGANLGSSDIEHVAMAGQIGQRDVTAFGHQAIAQTGSVDIKRNVVTATHLINIVKLASGIERAQFGGEGDVHQSGVYGMILVAVVHIVVQVLVEHAGLHLAEGISDGDDLMLGELDGTGLVDVDMTRAHTDDTLVLIEHRVDGGSVGLGTSRQEEYLRVGHANGLADAVLGALGELVEAIGCGLGIVITHQVFQHFRMGPVVVVAIE